MKTSRRGRKKRPPKATAHPKSQRASDASRAMEDQRSQEAQEALDRALGSTT